MPDLYPDTPDFMSQIKAVIEDNLSDEQFGVSELANELHMSRSNLLRKVKHLTNLSVSQFIRQVRLEHSMSMLRTSQLTISEIAYQVGFGSTSYFIKCFREHYGYPPGETHKRIGADKNNITDDQNQEPKPLIYSHRKSHVMVVGALAVLVLLIIGLLGYYWWSAPTSTPLEKSIAVLPFKNESSDSTNRYLINGLMESTLNNLQQIKDLKVISRTSAEKYRNVAKSIPEMAKELNARYFVEGSGQKMGDQLLLSIQLIDGPSDRHLWAKQYRRQAIDIFLLQEEIAKDIAKEVQAIVTQDERRRIEKKPTESLVAYDLFLKGIELLRQEGSDNLKGAIGYFKQAIGHDEKFALAYACSAIACYYLDLFMVDQQYGDEIADFADKAIFHDPILPESLIAKALSYAHKKEYKAAIPYFEKALAYNPNSILAINFLSDFYNSFTPNTAKYLEYALRGLRLDAAARDSAASSLNYLHLSNAFIQTGFLEEALVYIDKSLDYNPTNSFAVWVKAVILFARDKNTNAGRQLLLKELERDPNLLYILQELAKVYHYDGDDERAYQYYKRFIEIRERYQLDIFRNVNLTIAIVLANRGFREEADKFAANFKAFSDDDQTIYKPMHLALYYLYQQDAEKAINHLRQFSEADNYQYWILLLPNDPIVDPIRDHPEFKRVMHTIETKFWKQHDEIKASLEAKRLL
ncbi:helix-turn-helix domain-containing protein [Parapedobacter koreensis]|uniref:TolB amino-terminal domain-containing protein n=1 Tax=Parapedobacter koreensis TaxID=332977 RepID=A0A1H7R1Y8_9SPHI|nr:helix-turn-helix domain-containing protein [Parapedobacter koreensis]SEL54008.1 TolB amino-terminal domain-containing protein [Parapedobacter koreensis]